MKEKKILYLISGITVCIFVIGVSFAFWYLNLEQTTPNVVTSGCFSMEFTEGNAISLNDAYPVSDEEGMKLTPYTFTIQNTCTTDSNYQINLETLTGNGKVLPDKYLKASLDEGNENKITTKLDKTINSELETETTIEGATTAYKLLTGTLTPSESKNYSLHLWMHSDVGPSSDSMNATYQGKINIVTSYTRTLATLEDTIKSIPIVTSGDGLYEVSHSDAEITYTTDSEQQNMLKQTELRYAGSNPNNYVEFNDELWRIIGLVNTPEGQRVKMVRNEGILGYIWDSSDSNVNFGAGVNEWSTSKVNSLLNEGPYYTRSSGLCYSDARLTTVSCDFAENGLGDDAKLMIDSITWNTGSNGSIDATTSSIAKLYDYERSNYNGKECSSGGSCTDEVARTITWKGKIGLIYPSDYVLATLNVDLNQILETWNQENHLNWLSLSSNQNYYYTLTPRTHASASNHVFNISSSGQIESVHTAGLNALIRPSLYLNSAIKVISGDGRVDTPYKLSL